MVGRPWGQTERLGRLFTCESTQVLDWPWAGRDLPRVPNDHLMPCLTLSQTSTLVCWLNSQHSTTEWVSQDKKKLNFGIRGPYCRRMELGVEVGGHCCYLLRKSTDSWCPAALPQFTPQNMQRDHRSPTFPAGMVSNQGGSNRSWSQWSIEKRGLSQGRAETSPALAAAGGFLMTTSQSTPAEAGEHFHSLSPCHSAKLDLGWPGWKRLNCGLNLKRKPQMLI